MPLFRNQGSPTTIAAGKTQFWTYSFSPLSDVGVALVTPNLLEDQIKVELVAFDHGVSLLGSGGEGGSTNQYNVSIQSRGENEMMYNLNIWIPS